MSLISQINELLLSAPIQKYIETAYAIKREADDPFLSYFGINYKQDELISVKVYFEFHNKLSTEDISRLLPDNELLLKYYHKARLGKIHDENHTGVTFALKINPKKELTHYFHLIMDGKPERLPERIQLNTDELSRLNNIISAEYKENTLFQKHYNIVWDKKTIQHLIKKFNVAGTENIKSLEHIEYTETDKFDKIMLGIKNMEEQKTYMNTLPNTKMKEIIQHICTTYKLMTGSSSIYSDKNTRAVYFVLERDKLFFNTIDTIGELKNSLFKTGIKEFNY